MLFYVFIYQYSHAQNRTNVWELSYNPALDSLAYPACGINFNSGKADTFTTYSTMSFYTTDASICDTNGNLLFYTNGIFVANKNNDTLLNSANFDTGWATTFYGSGGLGIDQGAVIIPYPGQSTKYYIFYVNAVPINTNFDIQPLYLSYSIVDMNLGGGLGGIIANKKNIHLINDTLTLGMVTVVKHANGRDWWIIAHRYNSNTYYKLLITPDSIYGPYKQDIGSIISLGADGDGQVAFSPDGSKFAMLDELNILDFMDFDRCTGDFYNTETINVPKDSSLTEGCQFSPDSRFLYVNSRATLFQYDTWASNIANSAIKIAVWDTFSDPIYKIPTLFNMEQLAPDGKIYMSTWNSSKYLNRINNPDSLGVACNFTQDSTFVLPQYNLNIPSFPTYDLGALSGSPCDTLNGIKQVSVNTTQLSIFPNPTFNQLNIIYNISQQCTLELFDVLGREVMRLTLYPYFKSRILDVTGLTAGMYELRLITGNEEAVKKFVKE